MGTESKQNGNKKPTESQQKTNRKPTESHFSQFSQIMYRKQKEERRALDLLIVSNLLPNDKSPHPLV